MKLFNLSLAFVTALGTTALFATPAAAQAVENIGTQGQFVIGAERLTGIFWDKETSEGVPDDRTDTSTTIALLAHDSGSPSNVPRLGFDYLVTDGLTIGGSLYVAHISRSSSQGDADADGPSTTAFYINPRVGYAYAFDDTFGIWPRGGIAYYSFKQSGPEDENPETTRSGPMLTLEGNFYISPIQHFAITAGPFLDLGLGGTQETKIGSASTDGDFKYTSFGLSAGLAAYF
jgi:hypothetical protein